MMITTNLFVGEGYATKFPCDDWTGVGGSKLTGKFDTRGTGVFENFFFKLRIPWARLSAPFHHLLREQEAYSYRLVYDQ